jgi:hypothetical protein
MSIDIISTYIHTHTHTYTKIYIIHKNNVCINKPDIITEKTERNPNVTHLSECLENGEHVYFTENNFQNRLSSPQKHKSSVFFLLGKDY